MKTINFKKPTFVPGLPVQRLAPKVLIEVPVDSANGTFVLTKRNVPTAFGLAMVETMSFILKERYDQANNGELSTVKEVKVYGQDSNIWQTMIEDEDGLPVMVNLSAKIASTDSGMTSEKASYLLTFRQEGAEDAIDEFPSLLLVKERLTTLGMDWETTEWLPVDETDETIHPETQLILTGNLARQSRSGTNFNVLDLLGATTSSPLMATVKKGQKGTFPIDSGLAMVIADVRAIVNTAYNMASTPVEQVDETELVTYDAMLKVKEIVDQVKRHEEEAPVPDATQFAKMIEDAVNAQPDLKVGDIDTLANALAG